MTFVGTAIALLFKLLGLWEFSPDLYVGFGIQIPTLLAVHTSRRSAKLTW